MLSFLRSKLGGLMKGTGIPLIPLLVILSGNEVGLVLLAWLMMVGVVLVRDQWDDRILAVGVRLLIG
ncbi:hypothetical protein TNCV_2502871 [Trichonephila clavipes]|nr:hypothetical protein TNCV_2502871 [Trichonephila clavipes]